MKKLILNRYLLMFVIFILCIIVLIIGINDSDMAAKRKEINQMKNAINRSVIECYSLEGRYPQDFQYLQDNYQIRINKKRYKVYYQYQGDNIMPEINIIEKE